MTKAEIIDDLKTRDTDWLESRWSVLNEAVKAIEPYLAEVEAAFDYDYTTDNGSHPLEKQLCDQVLELCCIVTTPDTTGGLSWSELVDLINAEIERRESPPKVSGESVKIGGCVLQDSSGREFRFVPSNLTDSKRHKLATIFARPATVKRPI